MLKPKKRRRLRLLTALLLFLLVPAACTRTETPEPATAAPETTPVALGTAAPTSEPGTDVPTNAPAAGTAVSVLFLNVGKADAALIEIGGHAYLIDTGTKKAADTLLAALSARGVTKLDGVFLTHTHADHIGGFKTIAETLPIEQMYRASISENKKDGENKIDNLSEKNGVPLTQLFAGQTVPLADGLSFEVLGPRVYNADDDNDNSLVLRLAAYGKTFLFTGDMQFAEERTLLDAGSPLAADVLKVGNHGNPDATSEEFAQAVSPSLAVISTDTHEDTDSANLRVRQALAMAEIRVTENVSTGILVTVSPEGVLTVSNLDQ